MLTGVLRHSGWTRLQRRPGTTALGLSPLCAFLCLGLLNSPAAAESAAQIDSSEGADATSDSLRGRRLNRALSGAASGRGSRSIRR